jgi:WD40 repeat protein
MDFDALGAGLLDLLILIFFGSGYSNDLVSLIDAEAYFKSRQMEVRTAAMVARAGQDPTNGKASVAQLLAIRWLGEHADQMRQEPRAREVLTQIALGRKGQDPQGFAREYAQHALARLDGKPVPLWLLPENSVREDALKWFPDSVVLVGALDLRRPTKGTLTEEKLFTIVREHQARVRPASEIYKLAETVGNVRLDRVSLAIEPRSVSVVVRFTGLGNFKWLAKALQPEKAFIREEKGTKEEPITLLAFTPADPALALVGDTDFLVAFKYPAKELEIVQILEKVLAVRATDQKSMASGHLATVVKRTSPRAHGLLLAGGSEDVRIWLNEMSRDLFGVFPRQAALELTQEKNVEVRWHASFPKRQDAEQFVDHLNQLKQQGTDVVKGWRDADNKRASKVPYIQLLKILENVKLKVDGSTVSGGVQISGDVRQALENYLVDKYLTPAPGATVTPPQAVTPEPPSAGTKKRPTPRETPREGGKSAADWSKVGPTDSYGDPLPPGAVARLGTRRLQHAARISSVVFSPDGKTLAAADEETHSQEYTSTVRLWEAATGKAIRVYASSPRGFYSVVLSPDGKTLAAIRGDQRIYLWETATGKELHQFPGTQSVYYANMSLAFSPDGKTLAVARSMDSKVRLWEVATGKEVRVFQGDRRGVNAVAFSPDGKTLASIGRTIRLWEVTTGQEIAVYGGGGADGHSLVFSPDGQTLATVGRTVRLWEVATGKIIRQWKEGDIGGFVNTVAFSPDGKTLAAAGTTIHLWEVAQSKEIRSWKVNDSVSAVSFSPDGKTLASAGSEGRICLWETVSGREIRPFVGHRHEVGSVVFSPDGKMLASGSGREDRTILLWEVATGKELRALTGHQDWVQSLAFSPDGQTLASASQDRTIRLWEVATGKELRVCRGHQEWVNSVVFSPDGKKLASAGGYDGTVRLWGSITGKEVRVFARPHSGVYSVTFSPDGRTLASGHSDGISLWDLSTGKQLRTWPGFLASDRPVLFTPDGRTLISGGETTIQLFEVASGKEIPRFQGLQLSASSLALSPDGRILASAGSRDKIIRVWEMATGKELGVFRGHDKEVHSLAFSPNGKNLASGSVDTTVLIWDVRGLVSKDPR